MVHQPIDRSGQLAARSYRAMVSNVGELANDHLTISDIFVLTDRSIQGEAILAEQGIKEGKQAAAMTRLSCHRFRSNEVRLWLSLIAYNLGNLWRRLVLQTQVATWSLTSLQQRFVKTGGRLVKHASYYWFLLAESHLTRGSLKHAAEDRSAAVASGIRRSVEVDFDDDAWAREKYLRMRSEKDPVFRCLRAKGEAERASCGALESLWTKIRVQTLRLSTTWSWCQIESGFKTEIPA